MYANSGSPKKPRTICGRRCSRRRRAGTTAFICSGPLGAAGQALLAPIRLFIESVYDTLKGQFDVELHGGRSRPGVTVRIAQRLVGLTAAIWHNRVAVGTARTRRWNPIRSAEEAQSLAARGGGTLGF